MKKLFFYFLVSLFIIACEKPAGEGGSSVIEGEVWELFTYQNPTNGNWDTTFYRPDIGQDVYIIYSDNYEDLYDDKFETDWDGRYSFEFLRKGQYTIFTHVDSIVVNDITYDYPVFKSIEISSNNSIVNVPDFIINK